jgi:nucleoside-diphosphate-sugar epimerase
LCDLLLSEGHELSALDNVCTGSVKNLKGRGVEFIKGDVKNTTKLEGKFDYIFHLASRASPIDFKKYPIDILLTNGVGTYNMLRLAEEKGAKFLFSSTSEAYGDPKEHPQKETYWGNVNPIGVRSCYDESKRYGEAMCMAFLREKNLDVRIVRIFNTYGPRMRAGDGRVIPNFINQALRGEPITIYGDGSQTRSFCYVSDLIEGIQRAMFKEGTKGGVINMGNPEEHTILESAKIIKKLCKSDSKIVFSELPKDDPTRRRPDITKAKKLLGWEPKVKFEDGLKKTIDYFRGLNGNN